MQSILSAPKWSTGTTSTDEDEEDTRTSSDCGRSAEPARKLAKAGPKSSAAAAAHDQKPGDARKQQSKEKPGKADRAGEQHGRSKGGGTAKGPDVKMKSLASIASAQPRPKSAAPPGVAVGGKLGPEVGPGRSALARPDPSRGAGLQGTAATHKRSPLGPHLPTKTKASASAVWMGEPAAALSNKAGMGAKFTARQGLAPAAGTPSNAAAAHLAKKLPAKEHRHLGAGNGNSNSSSGADVNTAGGPLMLQPSDCFED